MIGIIGGSGVYKLTDKADDIAYKLVKTDYGEIEVSILDILSKKVVFIPRHSSSHSIPPHKINFKANIDALKNLGVSEIIATNSVGSLNLNMPPASFVIPDDFLDFTYKRDNTYYEDNVVHIDVTKPYCPKIAETLNKSGDVILGGTYVCTEGPRFETPAEIKMFKKLGGDLVGMTGLPEVVLAREREICYNSICIVSNYASGISKNNLTIDEVFEMVKSKQDDLLDLIYNFIKNTKDDDCECRHALDGACVNE